MRRRFLIAACISLLAVGAFAGEPATSLAAPTALGDVPRGGGGHGNTDDVLVDHLVKSVGDIANGFSATTSTSRWLAIDYTPSSGIRLEKVWFHHVYNRSSSSKGPIPMRLYSGTNPGAGSIVATWTVDTGTWKETNTGWSKWGRMVFLGEVPIAPQTLTATTRYWIAYQMTSSDNVFWAVRTQLQGEMIWWYLNGSWGTSQSKGFGVMEGSYKLEGTLSGVAPTSLGKVRALFK
ncbi:MAG: hypothetical protein GTN49_12780 [candidate division Zixibacteria bacterium]|nr:hypothetical protein [candidate division Zixibacteria bacterium]